MQELLQEILDGTEQYKLSNCNRSWSRGIGSKSYIIKRIDLLREKLLELKKDLQQY